MGFLDRIFSDSNQLNEHWTELMDIAQLEKVEQESFTQPVVLFKHSTTCGISAGAKYRLENEWPFEDEQFSFYYLDLLTHRNISNAIADRYGVIHQSPQLVILSQGKAVDHTSHHRISQDWLAHCNREC